MKLVVLIVLLCMRLAGQRPPAASEFVELQTSLAAQKERLRQQQERIQSLKGELAETDNLLIAWMNSKKQPLAQAVNQPPLPAKTKATAPPQGIRIPIYTGQEIATSAQPTREPAFRLGPADLRILGYVGLSGIFRSASMGGGPGTSFQSVPFSNMPAGNITEIRTTTQTSRLALRIDVPFEHDRLAGYIEADFSGATPGNALISSSSYGFRVRHAWVNFRHGKFEFAGGQMFSLLTPTKADIQTVPGDALTTQAVDTNYVAGLVWDRSPSIRAIYRPNARWSLAASIENPEQQVGSVVRFPAALAPVLSTQYNTGSGELKTPNLAPDTIGKVAWNRKFGSRTLHLDAGAVFRFFRSYDPSNITQHKTAPGVGGNLNITVDLTKALRLIGQGYLSSGGGRYVGGLLPDVIVRANGDISPVKAHSWVGGLEWAVSRRLSAFGYYSGVYGSRNTAIDTNGSQIGFGYSGSNSPRRLTQEFTGGWGQILWNGEDAGSLQYATQYSYLTNRP